MKKVIKDLDKKLNKLTHISNIENININLDYFLRFKNYDKLLINRKNSEIKFIKNPDFNVKTQRNLNSKGILKCFYPIQYDVTYGIIDYNSVNISEINKDFYGTKICRLRLNENLFRLYIENFYVDHIELKSIYYGLIKYMYSEKGLYKLNCNDFNYLFIKSLGLCCKNYSNELEKIINQGNNYFSLTSFLDDYKLFILNNVIKSLNEKHNIWTSFDTYLDNRELSEGKILTLKKQQKLN